MNPKQFAKKYGVKVKGKFYDNARDESGWEHTHYKVTVKYKDGDTRKLKFDFRMGTAHTDFDPHGALYGIGSDAKAGELYFELFCDEFGYDPDSIKNRKTWKACAKARRKVYNFCQSEDMYQDFLSLEY